MTRKKLLIITNRFYPQLGGAEINITFQARELAKEYDVEVVTPLRDNNPTQEVVDGYIITRVRDCYDGNKPFPNQAAVTLCPSIFFKVLFGNYHLIHCFPALNNNTLLAMIAAKMRGIPIFLSNFDLFDYASYLKKHPNDIDGIYKMKLGRKQQTFLKFFTSIFTISKRETQLIREVNPHTYLSTVPITLDEFEQPLDLDKVKRKYHLRNVPLLLCLSRISYLKGQDILIHALPLLKQRLKDFQVLVVGTDSYEPEYSKTLKRYVEEQDLVNNVIFTGAVGREEALAILKLCHIHILPVRYMNSGAVVIETWASRKPVIQSGKVDPNYVVEGENGYTFDLKNPRDIVDKICLLIENPAKCREMGEKGRKLVEEKFLYPQLIKMYKAHYRTS